MPFDSNGGRDSTCVTFSDSLTIAGCDTLYSECVLYQPSLAAHVTWIPMPRSLRILLILCGVAYSKKYPKCDNGKSSDVRFHTPKMEYHDFWNLRRSDVQLPRYMSVLERVHSGFIWLCLFQLLLQCLDWLQYAWRSPSRSNLDRLGSVIIVTFLCLWMLTCALFEYRLRSVLRAGLLPMPIHRSGDPAYDNSIIERIQKLTSYLSVGAMVTVFGIAFAHSFVMSHPMAAFYFTAPVDGAAMVPGRGLNLARWWVVSAVALGISVASMTYVLSMFLCAYENIRVEADVIRSLVRKCLAVDVGKFVSTVARNRSEQSKRFPFPLTEDLGEPLLDIPTNPDGISVPSPINGSESDCGDLRQSGGDWIPWDVLLTRMQRLRVLIFSPSEPLHIGAFLGAIILISVGFTITSLYIQWLSRFKDMPLTVLGCLCALVVVGVCVFPAHVNHRLDQVITSLACLPVRNLHDASNRQIVLDALTSRDACVPGFYVAGKRMTYGFVIDTLQISVLALIFVAGQALSLSSTLSPPTPEPTQAP